VWIEHWQIGQNYSVAWKINPVKGFMRYRWMPVQRPKEKKGRQKLKSDIKRWSSKEPAQQAKEWHPA
jgi:hypothetical protein